ncbi:hypothetical protein V8E52_007106 [Russula decolorans]|jgi:hypothetical protein
MLVLPTFLIFVSLSVAAIPLGPSANGQTPHIRRISSLIPAGLPNLPIPNALPPPAGQLLKSLEPKLLGRFIMGADYASSSGPFLGKSPHKRQDPLSGILGSTALPASDLKEGLSPNLSPTPT